MERGRQFRQKQVMVQRFRAEKKPGGSVQPHWDDDHAAQCTVIPLNAQDRLRFATPTRIITHKVRFDQDPGFQPVPGQFRIAFPIDSPRRRVLTCQGGYDVHELGVAWTYLFSEDSLQPQFQH